MIYLPKRFQNENIEHSLKLIEENPLATLISIQDSSPFFSHIPLVVESSSDQLVLIGHISKGNPHWKMMNDQPIHVIFNGPNEYISPKWSVENDVPTWNYAVAHLQGKVELVESFTEQVEVLKQLTYFFEKSNENPWEFELPDDLLDEGALTSAIILFKFKIEKIDSKFKLSQNRSAEDKAGVIDGLNERTDEMSRSVREMMIENE